MTAGKNKRVVKGKKTKKITDPFAKKEWFDVFAPHPFNKKKTEPFTKTPINKTAGTKISTEALKGRVFEISAADLLNEEEQQHQLIRLAVGDAKSENKKALTVFNGLRFTVDKLRSLVKKWHTLITTRINVKTADGFQMRVFALGITKRRQLQTHKRTYAYKSQVMRITARMKDAINKKATASPVNEFVEKVVTGQLGKEIEKSCASIFPMKDVCICKIKVTKTPKDLASALH
ncbi:40s ribosomal protein S3a [Naegleria gruberi]|uniref:40s ribosomal protein S3a n=1 Tax=Naegleria gruberi TaxID=5762 RepID=D2V3J3_NAEGR|nr:40s ribosomal protein S3a [Naegleria gruberi]EFC48648.1 40s ribosomal protein S3a [Naegleria gruberi]|eukprot:XP_002681392.1 40s ribosomal protein S3a [Naegleria gruberi strain NEG-M]